VEKYMRLSSFAGGGNIFVSRRVFDRVGAFDERLFSSGDMEFGSRVGAAGFRMYFDADNPMRHPARNCLSSHLKKALRIGRGHRDLRILFPHRFRRVSLLTLLNRLRPALRIGGSMSLDGLSSFRKLQMWFVFNILKAANALGQLSIRGRPDPPAASGMDEGPDREAPS
jgi:GT2 family glycosyltransferase